MQKNDFTNLVKKYYLDGQCPAVKWSINDKNLNIEFVSEDKSMKGSLDANLELEDGVFGIYDTDKLLSITNALDSEFDLVFHYEKNKPVGIRFDDKVVSATFMLADMSIIDDVPPTKSIPEFDVEVNLKKENIDRFVRSKKAMSDSNLVALIPNDDTLDFVINFAQQATNRIVVPFPATVTNSFEMVAFNASTLSSIFSVNTDFREATMKVAEKGLMMLEFKGEDYTSTYYLKKIEIH